jgi:hypothetical protein
MGWQDDDEIPCTLDGQRRWSNVCGWCEHKVVMRDCCAAFPDRIPDDIWLGRHTHRTPYPGDGGIMFRGEVKEFTADRYEIPDFLKKK